MRDIKNCKREEEPSNQEQNNQLLTGNKHGQDNDDNKDKDVGKDEPKTNDTLLCSMASPGSSNTSTSRRCENLSSDARVSVGNDFPK